jgi:hypothetical protein
MAAASRFVTQATGAALLLLASTGIPQAALRQPQAAVAGSGLQDLFNSEGEVIDVQTDQQDAGLLRSGPFNNPAGSFSVQITLVRTSGVASGIYLGHESAPAFIQVFSDSTPAGWFALVTFRDNPTRVVVNVFDAGNAHISTVTTLGGDRFGIGMYVSGPAGTFYLQDERNPGGRPQVLCYFGTGINSGSIWLCAEDHSLAAGADSDFDDVVWFNETAFQAVTPVEHSTWGSLKARFR